MHKLLIKKIEDLGKMNNEVPIMNLIVELRNSLNLVCDYSYIDQIKNKSVYVFTYYYEGKVKNIKFETIHKSEVDTYNDIK